MNLGRLSDVKPILNISQGNSFANTARWIAAVRAQESRHSDPLFLDPLAEIFTGDVGRAMLLQSEKASGGENLFLPVCARFLKET